MAAFSTAATGALAGATAPPRPVSVAVDYHAEHRIRLPHTGFYCGRRPDLV
jgi:hypothetical protein